MDYCTLNKQLDAMATPGRAYYMSEAIGRGPCSYDSVAVSNAQSSAVERLTESHGRANVQSIIEYELYHMDVIRSVSDDATAFASRQVGDNAVCKIVWTASDEDPVAYRELLGDVRVEQKKIIRHFQGGSGEDGPSVGYPNYRE